WHKLRQGACPNCPHDVVDSRDLKFVQNVCGWRFRPEGDVYASREGLGFARWGYAELIGFTVVFAALGGVLVVATQRLHWLFVIPLLATWAAIVGVVWFFRDPARVVPTDPKALLSPADGTVTHVDNVYDTDLLGGRALRVSIF